MSSPFPSPRLYLLAGPTASGKTDVAHLLAERMGLRLLSVDSMMVYRGMDIGTAKPSPADIRRFDYAGINLVDPGERFSTGAWLRAVRARLDDRPTLAVGGTGLYFRALVQGLAEEGDLPTVDDSMPAEELRVRIRAIDPAVLETLADPANPRRLARALAWLLAGRRLPDTWRNAPALVLPVLRRSTPDLNARIESRCAAMFAGGLLEEVRALRDAHGGLPGTASQAIGYREALAVLEGSLTREQAIAATVTRTRQYAKRQRTWFRNQCSAQWVDVTESMRLEEVADRVAQLWAETPPVFLYSA